MKLIKIIIPFLFVYITVVSCSSSQIETTIPSCIQYKIETFKEIPVKNPPAEIWSWNNDGIPYYYVTSECCDQYNYLYDASCNIVCAPDGGLTGNGDGKCPVFNNLQKTLIWKDNR